ncbi:ester cyclase [Nakamurella flava]|uniref:Ester cyclase n=1 Tax=Nakamurella flava TaxID=2576308 RepID=A0A4U6QCK8_9ACTN|nr:ester cyclase [Nakamurella flava]TKV57760.1 ester cyclase [Nakamurella flava]
MTMDSPQKAAIAQAWARAWDDGDVDALDDLLAPGFTRRTQGSKTSLSADELKKEIRATREAFPDLVTTIDEIVLDGDRVAIFWTSTGTHQAELLGIPATRRKVVTYGSNLCTLSDGKLTDERVTWDPRHLLTALGISTVRHD